MASLLVAAGLAANLLDRVPLADWNLSAGPSPRTLRATGNALYKEFRFAEAEESFSEGYRKALASKDRVEEVGLLINLGSVRFATFRYREAMEAFVEAARLARRLGDRRLLTYAISNLSSLYLQQQDVNAGIEAAKDLLEDVKGAASRVWSRVSPHNLRSCFPAVARPPRPNPCSARLPQMPTPKATRRRLLSRWTTWATNGCNAEMSMPLRSRSCART